MEETGVKSAVTIMEETGVKSAVTIMEETGVTPTMTLQWRMSARNEVLTQNL